ncbi:hypothetical protein CRG98_049677, partial [Punica granatum]
MTPSRYSRTFSLQDSTSSLFDSAASISAAPLNTARDVTEKPLALAGEKFSPQVSYSTAVGPSLIPRITPRTSSLTASPRSSFNLRKLTLRAEPQGRARGPEKPSVTQLTAMMSSQM